MFMSVLNHLSKWISVDRSVLLDRQGLFRQFMVMLAVSIQSEYPDLHVKFHRLGVSMMPYFYKQITSLFCGAFPTETLLRVWDLIFQEFSSPSNKSKTHGVSFIVATALFLLESSASEIEMAETCEEVLDALQNLSPKSLHTEYVVKRVGQIHD